MNRTLRFATARPLPFVTMATVVWIAVAGIFSVVAAHALDRPLFDGVSQSLGTLAATALLLAPMGHWGWLGPAGMTRLGSRRLWLVTAALAAYLVVVYQVAFFDRASLELLHVWREPAAWSIIGRQAVVGFVEETLFRAFLLYALVRVWGRSQRGLLGAVAVPAIMFGVLHALQALSGNPIDDTLMTILNCCVGGLWLGALVLLGGSIWPAVLLHAVGNATVQLGALSQGGIEPAVAHYAIATAAELPLVIASLWLLLRGTTSSLSPGARTSPGSGKVAGALGMRLFLLLALAGIPLLAGCAQESRPTPTATPTVVIESRLTQAQRREIFETVWQTVNDGYFDPTFGGKDWQAIGQRYRQALQAVQDDRAFWLDVLNPMLFELGVSHIGALPPELSSQMDPMTFSAGTLGMDVRLLDGQPVITEVVAGFPADEAGLRPGFVITALDGRAVEDIAADGLQTPPDNDRNRRANLVQNLRSSLYGEPDDDVEIAYLDAFDRPQRLTLHYAPRSASTCAQFDPSLPPACTELEVRRLPGGIGYIRFSGFLPTALDGVLQAIDDLQDEPALIVDLRGNPGGVFPVRKAIASKLVGTPELFMKYQRRDGTEEAYLDPVADAYQGRVMILVDELSASSSEEFAGSLQALSRAIIVGSQTPGRCLTANIVPLPHGGVLIYPFGQSQTPNGRVLEGNGVTPDIAVELHRDQVVQGIDPQLEAAIDFLTGL